MKTWSQAGVSVTAILPLSSRSSVVLATGYGQLLGDAAGSPLVRERGSEHQGSVALFYNYSVGAVGDRRP